MTTPLDEIVRDGLIRRKGDWKAIAEGSQVSYSWLSKFVNRKIPNPGFGTLSAIARHLENPPAPQAQAQGE